jgi:hypothetical protein
MDTANQPQPEFNSLVATIDHLSQINDGETRQKFVASTQSVTASLLALFAYYGESKFAVNERTIDLFTKAAQAENVVWVYRTPENIQIVTDMDTWNFACTDENVGNGSMLVATDALMQLTANAEAQVVEQCGGVVPLFFFSLTREAIEEPARPDVTAGVAADLVATAEVQDVS